MPVKARPEHPTAPDFQLLAAFHQLSPNPVVVVDADGSVTFVNDAAKRALAPLGPNASPAAFFPKDMDSILAHLRRRESAALRRDVAVGDGIFAENILVRPDHNSVLIHATDITELRRTDQELRRQDAFLKALVESPTDIHVFALDRNCCYTAFNTAHQQEMKRLYGSDIQAGTPLLDVISNPDVRSRMEQTIARALSGEGFTTVEFDSDLDSWHEFNWSPIRTPDGGVEGVAAFVQDITRRKRVETALADSELKYRRLFESSNDALMLLDTERFFDCNEATLRVFGCSTRDEFLGKHPADVSPPRQADGRDSRDAANKKIAVALRDGRNYFEWLHRRADGTVFPADVLLTPVDFRGRTVLQASVRDISDRKQAEAALAESEERYRLLVEKTGEGIGISHADERFFFANPAADALFGVPRGGLVGRSLLEFLDATQVEVIQEQTARRQAGFADTYDLEITRPDGTKRNALVTASPRHEADGSYAGAFAIFRDITERKQYRIQVEIERNRLRRILDAMPDGVYMVGQDWQLQYINPALLARGGQVGGRKCYEYFHGRTEPCPGCANQQVFAGGTTHREYTTRQGGVTYDIQDVLVTGDDGKPARLVFLRDITERKSAELRDKQHLADSALLRDTALGFITLDPNANIYGYVAQRLAQFVGEAYIVVNSCEATEGEFRVRAIQGMGDSAQAALKLLGRPPAGMTFRLTPEELREYASNRLMKIDGGLAALSSGELPEAVGDAIRSVFVLGDTYVMSLYWQGKILGTVYVLMHKDVPMRDPALVEAFVNQSAIAIQHRRDADELIRHREHLEELVRERTVELEAANRELEAFSYSVSHDLRAPLRAIDGFAQAVVEDAGPGLSQPARSHLDRVSAAAGRMGELIDDLLNLARIARLPLERKEIDLSELARNIAAELRRTAPDRRAEFVIPNGLSAPADRVLMEMVMQNLLSNAWKFTSRHQTARIEFGKIGDGGERVFFVRDDGAGFDMAYVDKLFVPFQRLHSGHEFPGSGIGLAIVQRIVRRHGGRVWFEAEIDRGATCWFTLQPRAMEEEHGRKT
jgi:PAS domain S-box-containing protein